MSQEPACYGGCCVANPYYPPDACWGPIPAEPIFSVPSFTFYVNPASLTKEELEVLNFLVQAWDHFVKLTPKMDSDFAGEFRDSIHRCQQIIALRVAQRVDPVVWRQPE